MSNELETEILLGDRIYDLAMQYADRINETDLATSCREQTLEKERYLGYVAAMYPIVVGFNRCLIRSIAKVDHVRNARLVKYLAEQLKEEQDHNALWRKKMRKYDIDHAKLYDDLENYLNQFSQAELDDMTARMIEVAREDFTNTAPGVFPNAVVPEPVLALYNMLYQTATDPTIDYWEHFICQSVVEFIIYEVVSTSVYPGIKDREGFDLGAVTWRWWAEHARQGSADGETSDEEKHLEMAKLSLNRSPEANAIGERLCERAEDAMALFAGTAACHDADRVTFSVRPYLKDSEN